nr:NAD/NADP transhydrogenase beta subunit [Mucilaginibacter sp. FT3.2]
MNKLITYTVSVIFFNKVPQKYKFSSTHIKPHGKLINFFIYLLSLIFIFL